ncbi:glycosyltransferase family 2 protein [Halopelagius longus]|uniref:Glycosyltransferase family 2 protein n=1 Tax=Halopelagius longus TaxID=1236180 RepID=A0A1H1GKX2_9EURY|nr:glycosyltransferase family 2 protein [Halopelagius longus]RDI69682.1 glycosyltransferase family 2 protein [Halopelagius longus]SDR13753.1 Glycosyltransferase involved in cell wall bisynthesis [Halopelagius longus]
MSEIDSNGDRANGHGGTVRSAGDLATDATAVSDSTSGPSIPENGAEAEQQYANGESEVRRDSDEGYLVTPESDLEPTLSVVIPTLNEEKGIAECINRVQSAVETMKVPTEIVVSDSSTDRTPEIAESMGGHVVEPTEGGYGAAYLHGFEHARGDYIAIGDADTTYDFEELPKLYELVADGDADMAMGSRLGGEIKPGAMPPLHQYIGNPLLTKFLNTFYDAGVSDAHSGFRVIDADALEQMNLQSTGMEFASEMIMQAGANDLEIAERPITYHERTGEATLDSFRDGWRHVRFMLVNAPGYLFSAPAIGFAVVGLLTIFGSLLGAEVYGVNFGMQTAFAGCVLTVIGHQVGSFALFSSYTTDPIRKPSDPITKRLRDSFRLEHGATLGFVLFGVGALYVVAALVRWASTGYTQLPAPMPNLFAMTVLIIGVQTVFSSFFLSMVANGTSQVN